MVAMDVFNNSAFSAISMTAAVNKIGYAPNLLRSMPGLFVPKPVRTHDVFIEERSRSPALIQTTPLGAPPKEKGGDPRTARSFRTCRLAQSSTIHAHEIQGIRAFGSETELKQVMVEVADRQSVMRTDVELTWEHMMLGAVQGLVVDADGTELYDWADIFDQAIPAAIDFDLDNASPEAGAIRIACNELRRGVAVSLKGLGGNAVRIKAVVGDAFYDKLTNHPEIRETYLNQQEARALRDGSDGDIWDSFSYAKIEFLNYRGTDDGSTVAVPDDEAKFFPVGAGIFQIAYGCAETFDFVNTLGRESYSWLIADRDRNAWVKPELYSYPLPVCTMPSALRKGVVGA
ncbi:major capsid protein [Ancylobacter mangrovi]|uniref:major capsid protein n=1 Tax=Ancylobacter mangrovi TaxID=2972472 RepID=UPI002163B774|nr:major capsid protein [Ancylobacter mangrovi]MCS0501384.1 major capsid protein [Ancylobacter mangrovi]